MRLFAKKSNPQPAKSDIPPELRPFYDAKATEDTQPARRALPRWLIPVIVLLVIVGLALGLWAVTRNHSQPTSLSSQSASTQNQSSTSPYSSPNSAANNQAITQPQSSQSTTNPPAPAPSTAIPNTGPGSDVMVGAVAIGIAATLGSYIRQLRRLPDSTS